MQARTAAIAALLLAAASEGSTRAAAPPGWMADFATAALGVAALLSVGLLALFAAWWSRRGRAAGPDPPGRPVAVLMRQRPDYEAHVGLQPGMPERWARAVRLHGDAVEVESHGDIALAEVRAFVVT